MAALLLTKIFCYCIKQIDSILPCACSVIDHRRRQNVVRTLVMTQSPNGFWATFLFLPPEVYNTRSLHLGYGVANMSFASNLFLDCLFVRAL